MRMGEYVRQVYPVREQVRQILGNPISKLLQDNDLPFDEIRLVDGEMQKVVYLNDDEAIPVMDLISYTESDIEKIGNPELTQVYKAYMQEIQISDMDLTNLASLIRAYKEVQKRKKGLLEKCTNW